MFEPPTGPARLQRRAASALLAVLLLAAPSARAGTEEIPDLLRQIARGDRPQVDAAVARLTFLGVGRNVGESLGLLLTSPDPRVRESASYALASLPAAAQGAQKPLVAALEDEGPLVRAQAARALGRAGVRKAGPALARAAADPNPSVRKAALVALGSCAEPKDRYAAAPVLAALADPDPEVQAAGCEAASRLQLAAAKPALLGILAGRSELLRLAAARALLRIGAPEAKSFAETLLGGDEGSRAEGCRLLDGTQERWAKERLMALLMDPVLPVRCACARALAAQDDELGLAFLVVGAETSPDGVESLAYARILDDLQVPHDRRKQLKKKHVPAERR